MKTVKFVGGPFHGTTHEVQDDVVELRLPIMPNYSLRYVAPKPDEFVFASKDLEETIDKPILRTPNIVYTKYYIFQLIKLDKEEYRGPRRERDTCNYKITIKDRHSPLDTSFITTFKIWQWYDHFCIEPSKEHKYDVSFINMQENEFDTDFIYGLGKLLEQNGFVR